MYFNMAQQAYAAFDQGIGNYWAMFRVSLADNYNLIFTLPSLVSFSLFGVSRGWFLFSPISLSFFLLTKFPWRFLLRRALGWRGARRLSSALLPHRLRHLYGCLCWKVIRIMGLRHASCSPLGLAGVARGKQPGISGARLVLAFVLGFAVLLRRHFVYPAIALLGGAWLSRDLGYCARATGSLAEICGARRFISCFAVLRFVGHAGSRGAGFREIRPHHRLRRALSFLSTSGAGVSLFHSRRIRLWAAAGGRERAVFAGAQRARPGASLRCLPHCYVLLWLVIWCLGPDQMGHHYILHALPLFVAVGISRMGRFF